MVICTSAAIVYHIGRFRNGKVFEGKNIDLVRCSKMTMEEVKQRMDNHEPSKPSC